MALSKMDTQRLRQNSLASLSLSIDHFFSVYPFGQTHQTTALFEPQGQVNHDQLIRESLSLAHRLATSHHEHWALACEDTGMFIRGLLALLAAGKTICLPPNSQPGTLSEISQKAPALMTDGQGEGFPGEIVFLSRQTLDDEPRNTLSPVLKSGKLIFFTSGSSGQPQAVSKQLWQLENEINALEQLWGARLSNAVIMACVAHQHIYGVLFRVLWPLLAGRPIDTTHYEYPESLLAGIQRYSSVAIIASPAQLERLPVNLNWNQYGHRVNAVFSSGAPLPEKFAAQAKKCFDSLPLEVLGSTETGGVAWREQHHEQSHENYWNPLPGVTTGLMDDRLTVYSPWLDQPDEGTVMGDKAELCPNGQFLLKGRADLIVKIEGKRVSLTELATRLTASSLIDKAETVLLAGHRRQIGAVVVLSTSGQALLAEQGRLTTARQLKKELAQYFEAVTLPRKWRYLATMPVNTQGKLVRSRLIDLFNTGDSDD